MIALLLMVNMFAFASAELKVSGFRAVVGNNETSNSMTISIEDTSPDGILKRYDNNISVFINHYPSSTPIPSGETLALCNYNAIQTINQYDSLGVLANSTTLIDTVVYNYSATSIRYYSLREQDTLKIDLNCFWDIDVNDTMFQYLSPSIVGLGINSFSFACGDCARQDYEEVLNDYAEAKAQTQNYFNVFNNMMTLALNNIEIWYMTYWIVKIALWLVLVMLVFMAGIWLYHFFKDLARNI